MKRIMLWILGLGVAMTLAASLYFRTASDDAAKWHVDPVSVKRTGNPNDYVVAPEGIRSDAPDRLASVTTAAPKDLLFQFDSIAGAVATRLAGSLDELHITYVERTALMGYPDYITVKAVEVEGGSALVIYSRSRFGKSDFGVNRERIDRWLAQIGDS